MATSLPTVTIQQVPHSEEWSFSRHNCNNGRYEKSLQKFKSDESLEALVMSVDETAIKLETDANFPEVQQGQQKLYLI
jgi:hypothetical protein